MWLINKQPREREEAQIIRVIFDSNFFLMIYFKNFMKFNYHAVH